MNTGIKMLSKENCKKIFFQIDYFSLMEYTELLNGIFKVTKIKM